MYVMDIETPKGELMTLEVMADSPEGAMLEVEKILEKTESEEKEAPSMVQSSYA